MNLINWSDEVPAAFEKSKEHILAYKRILSAALYAIKIYIIHGFRDEEFFKKNGICIWTFAPTGPQIINNYIMKTIDFNLAESVILDLEKIGLTLAHDTLKEIIRISGKIYGKDGARFSMESNMPIYKYPYENIIDEEIKYELSYSFDTNPKIVENQVTFTLPEIITLTLRTNITIYG